MKTIKLKEVYNVTQISCRNQEPWNKIIEIISGWPNEDKIIVDTEGVILEDPCFNPAFKKLMGDKRVKIIVYNSSLVAERIRVLCTASGYDLDRVENKGEIKIIKKNTKEYDDGLVAKFEACCQVNNDERALIFMVKEAVTQIGNPKTAYSLREAMLRKIKETGYKEVILDFGNIFIQEITLGLFHKIVKEAVEEDERLEVKIANLYDAQKFNMFKSAGEGFNSDKPLIERLQLFKDNIPLGMVGLLCRYKQTRRKDMLGRSGDGAPLWSRFAIYRGVEKKGDSVKDGIYVKFQVFRANDFYTKIHKIMEDNDPDPELRSELVKIDFDELGILNLYTGSDYHFNSPEQYRENASIYMRTIIDIAGKSVTAYGPVRLPNAAKAVLDDYGIKYDKEKLDEAIKNTAEIFLKNPKGIQ